MESSESEDLALPIDFWRLIHQQLGDHSCGNDAEVKIDTKLHGLSDQRENLGDYLIGNNVELEIHKKFTTEDAHGTTTQRINNNAGLKVNETSIADGSHENLTKIFTKKRKHKKGPIVYSDSDSDVGCGINKTKRRTQRGKFERGDMKAKRAEAIESVTIVDESGGNRNECDSRERGSGYDGDRIESTSIKKRTRQKNKLEIVEQLESVLNTGDEQGCGSSKNNTDPANKKIGDRSIKIKQNKVDRDNIDVQNDKNTSNDSSDNLDISELEKRFYIDQDKLTISRSRFGSLRRKNYKYAPIIFSDENDEGVKKSPKKLKCKLRGTNLKDKMRKKIVFEQLTGCDKTLGGTTDPEICEAPVMSVSKTSTKLNIIGSKKIKSSSDDIVQKKETISNTEISVTETSLKSHVGKSMDNDNQHDSKTRKTDIDNSTCSEQPKKEAKVTKTGQVLCQMSELFFESDSYKVKPAPGKRKASRTSNCDNTQSSGSIAQSSRNILQSPANLETTLLDDNDLWSSPKKLK